MKDVPFVASYFRVGFEKKVKFAMSEFVMLEQFGMKFVVTGLGEAKGRWYFMSVWIERIC